MSINRRAFCDITNQINVNTVNTNHNRCKSSPPRVTKCRMRLEDLGQPVQRFVKELRKEGCVPNGRLALLKYVSVKQLAVVYDAMANGKPASLIWGDIEDDLLAQCKDYNNGELDIEVDMNESIIVKQTTNNNKRELTRSKSESSIRQLSPTKVTNTIGHIDEHIEETPTTPKQQPNWTDSGLAFEDNHKRVPKITIINKNSNIPNTPIHQCSHTSMDFTPPIQDNSSPKMNDNPEITKLDLSPPRSIIDDQIIESNEQFLITKTSKIPNSLAVILFNTINTTNISLNYSYYTSSATINDLITTIIISSTYSYYKSSAIIEDIFKSTISLNYNYYTKSSTIEDLLITTTKSLKYTNNLTTKHVQLNDLLSVHTISIDYSYYTTSSTIDSVFVITISCSYVSKSDWFIVSKQFHNTEIKTIEILYCGPQCPSITESNSSLDKSNLINSDITTTRCVLDLAPVQTIISSFYNPPVSACTPTNNKDRVSRDMGTQWPEIPQGSPSCPPSSTVSLDLMPVVIIPEECVIMSETQTNTSQNTSSTESSEDNELFPSSMFDLNISNIPNESTLHTKKSWNDIMKKRKLISEKKLEEYKKRLEVADKLELQKKKEEEQKLEEERRRNDDRIKRELERMRREEEKTKKEEERNREMERRREEERRKREQEKQLEESKKQEELIRKQKERLAKEEEAKKKREERLKKAASTRCQCCANGRGNHASPSKSS